MKIRHVLPAFGFVPKNPEESAYGGMTMTALQLALRQQTTANVSVVGLSRERESFTVLHGDVLLKGIKPWYWAQFGRLDLHYFAPVLYASLPRRVDILHCYTDPTLLYLPAQYRVLHLQNVIRPLESKVVAQALKRADAIICCSKFVQAEALKQIPGALENSVVVHNGGTRHTPDGMDFRQQLGLDEHARVILFVGAITPQKGLHVLVEAIRVISSELDNVRLLVAGSSQLWYNPRGKSSASVYEHKLIEATQELPIHFLGRVTQEEMGDLYRAADVFCCPSVWEEPFGIVNVEALAAGLPVVACSVGGIPEIVNGDVGRLVPPNDAKALADALRKLLQDEDLRLRLAANALVRAKLFNWDNAASKVERIYTKISNRYS